MKELYTALSIEITELDADDVITTSSMNPEDFGSEGWGDGDSLVDLM